jgi:hypothetical protein
LCAPGADLSEGFKGTVRAGTGPRGRGAGGVAGGACFSRRRCRRREPLVWHWVVLQRMRSRVVRAWTICTVRRSPGWVRFCMVGLNVGSEAGGISPEISPAWAVYTAEWNWSPHLWRRGFVAVDHGAAIKVWRGRGHAKRRIPSYAETPHSAGLSAGRSGPSPARRRTCQDEHARKQPPAAARARRFAAKSAPAGQRQIRNHSVPSTSASGSGETRLRRFTVNAACCADLFWIYRGSLPLSTP